MAAPVITFTHNKERIGGNDSITVVFSADIDMSATEIRATKDGESYGLGIGTLVHADSYTPAGAERTFEIYDTNLVSGDGVYRISLYGQSMDGTWNDGRDFYTSDGKTFKTSDDKIFRAVAKI